MTKFLEENDLIGTDYAEPYAGGAGLALRLMMDEYVGDIFINDLDPSIYAFWYAVLNRTDALCAWIEQVPVNRTNVSGVISGGIIGGINQTGKYKINARFNKTELISRIREIQRFSHRIHLSNLDGIDFVKQLERKKKDVFFYLDPPYCKKGPVLYMNAFCDKDHKKLADYVKTMRKKWIISYDNQEFIMQLYENNKKVQYQLSQCASNRVGDEILIFDDRLHYNESISQLNNALFV